jgi:hypothetical protein
VTETPSETRVVAMQMVAPHMLDDAPVIAALGKHLLREEARAVGRVLAGEVVETKREAVVFVTMQTDDGLPSQQPVEIGSMFGDLHGVPHDAVPDAYMLAWEAGTADRVADPEPVAGVLEDDDAFRRLFRGRLDEHTQLNGGQVIFRHGIDGEAIIRAYNQQDQPMSYLFAVQIQPGEHQLEVFPGTVSLTAEPDPDDPEGDDQ